jgi:hypothetical protein
MYTAYIKNEKFLLDRRNDDLIEENSCSILKYNKRKISQI